MKDACDESAFWTTTDAGYKQKSSTAIIAGRAPEAAHRGYAALLRVGTAAQALGDVLQSLYFSEAVSQKSVRDFPQSMHSASRGDSELRAKDSWAPWSQVVSVEHEQRDKSGRDAVRPRHAPTREMMLEYFESERSLLCAAWTWAAMDI